ncbi:hypothetical protein B0H13DRAFT_2289399 [Mycena leptocephala]|nr:hypothetical protein B0H13DRAFT_2289399 [Mycena leptocephala]
MAVLCPPRHLPGLHHLGLRHTLMPATHSLPPALEPTLQELQLTAGSATQGVCHASVRTVLHSPKKNKKRTGRKAAYAVFRGRGLGVFLTWNQTEPLVCRISGCLFRGYDSLEEAQALSIMHMHAPGHGTSTIPELRPSLFFPDLKTTIHPQSPQRL